MVEKINKEVFVLQPGDWNPLREVKSLRDQMNKFLDETFHPDRAFDLRPSVDVYETEEEVIAKADIPGIDPSEIEIMVSENNLIIQGEVSEGKEVGEEGYHKVERQIGNFKRSITLPAKIKHEEAKASAAQGVLEIRMPKVEEEIEEVTTIEVEH